MLGSRFTVCVRASVSLHACPCRLLCACGVQALLAGTSGWGRELARCFKEAQHGEGQHMALLLGACTGGGCEGVNGCSLAV